MKSIHSLGWIFKSSCQCDMLPFGKIDRCEPNLSDSGLVVKRLLTNLKVASSSLSTAFIFFFNKFSLV